MEPRTDRIGLLTEQLTGGVQLSRLRIDGMTNQEMVWEPYPNMWSVRRQADAVTKSAYGPGPYVLDFVAGGDPFAPAPVTTIAWRVAHLVSMFAGRYEWTFGSRSIEPTDLVEFSTGVESLGQLWDLVDQWVDAIEHLDDDQLDEVGFGQYPYGLDRQLPFIAIVSWMNRETIHHLAEVALLRDLFLAAGDGGAMRPTEATRAAR